MMPKIIPTRMPYVRPFRQAAIDRRPKVADSRPSGAYIPKAATATKAQARERMLAFMMERFKLTRMRQWMCRLRGI